MKIILFFFINNISCSNQEDIVNIIDYINTDYKKNPKDQIQKKNNIETNSIQSELHNNIFEKSIFMFSCHLIWVYFLIKQEINQEQDKIFVIGTISLNILTSPIILGTKENGICLLMTISLIFLAETCIYRFLSKDTYTPTPYIFQKLFYELILYSFMLTYVLKTNNKTNKTFKKHIKNL